jgi:hypothetical protein
VFTGTGWGASGIGAGTSAAGNSGLGGLLVQAQTDTGTINHALAMAIEDPLLKTGYVAPAISADGRNTNGILQEGQLLAIPPGQAMPSGLSSLGQKVFSCLKQYGVYITDNGVDLNCLRAQANAYNSTIMNALNTDLNVVLRLLKIVS